MKAVKYSVMIVENCSSLRKPSRDTVRYIWVFLSTALSVIVVMPPENAFVFMSEVTMEQDIPHFV